MAKVVVYLRVSSREQETENQLPALKHWIASRGHELVAMYSEEESAWRSGHQHQLSRLMADLPKHRPQYLLIWALDRLCRQGIAVQLQLVNSFRLHGVTVISLQQPWTEQPPGPLQDLLFSLYAYIAQDESRRISERTLAGLARARANGKHLGRPQGSKDKKRRKRFGYFNRYAKQRAEG